MVAALLRVAAINSSTDVNGPGLRTVVHFRGCNLKCAGCFNPELWSVEGAGAWWSAMSLANEVAERGLNVSISGGEPFQQPALLQFLAALRWIAPKLTVIVFTGYTYDELVGGSAGIADVMPYFAYIDLMVAGRYDNASAVQNGLISSTNQSVIRFSGRIRLDALQAESRRVSVTAAPDGTVTITGFPTKGEVRSLKKL